MFKNDKDEIKDYFDLEEDHPHMMFTYSDFVITNYATKCFNYALE